MTTTSRLSTESTVLVPTRRPSWTLWGSAAGALGLAATLIDSRPPETVDGKPHTISATDMGDLNASTFHLTLVLGYLAVACLLVFAANWRRNVEICFPGSVGASVVHGGLLASAGALSLAYGWKGALGLYLDGASESTTFDENGRFVYFVLNDFGPFVGWLGVCVAGIAMGWMAWREQLLSRPLGTISAVLNLGLLVATFATTVPGLPFASAFVLTISGLWLAVSGSSFVRGEA